MDADDRIYSTIQDRFEKWGTHETKTQRPFTVMGSGYEIAIFRRTQVIRLVGLLSQNKFQLALSSNRTQEQLRLVEFTWKNKSPDLWDTKFKPICSLDLNYEMIVEFLKYGTTPSQFIILEPDPKPLNLRAIDKLVNSLLNAVQIEIEILSQHYSTQKTMSDHAIQLIIQWLEKKGWTKDPNSNLIWESRKTIPIGGPSLVNPTGPPVSYDIHISLKRKYDTSGYWPDNWFEISLTNGAGKEFEIVSAGWTEYRRWSYTIAVGKEPTPLLSSPHVYVEKAFKDWMEFFHYSSFRAEKFWRTEDEISNFCLDLYNGYEAFMSVLALISTGIDVSPLRNFMNPREDKRRKFGFSSCIVCNSKAELECSNCETPYCSERCQLRDWNVNMHASVCN
jgi:hypothetical protein